MDMKNKNRFGSIALKSFIVIAVVMMLFSVVQDEAYINMEVKI